MKEIYITIACNFEEDIPYIAIMGSVYPEQNELNKIIGNYKIVKLSDYVNIKECFKNE